MTPEAGGALHDEVGGTQLRDVPDHLPIESHILPFEGDDGLLPRQKPEHPQGGQALADDGGEGRPLHAHAEGEDEHRIEGDVRRRADDDGEHPDPGKALGVDVAVEACGDHGEGGAHQVHVEVRLGVDVGVLAGPEGKEDGPHEQIPHRHEHGGADELQCEGVAQNAPGPSFVPGAPGDGKEGHAAGAEQGREAHDQGDDGKGEAHAGEGHAAPVPHVAEIDPIHHVVEEVHQLGHDQRPGLVQNAPPHRPLGKVRFRLCPAADHVR